MIGEGPNSKRPRLKNIGIIKHGLHLNRVPDAEQENNYNMKDIITKIRPKKSYFFTFIVNEDFIRDIFSNHPEGLNDVHIILGVNANDIKEIKNNYFSNNILKIEYVPMKDKYCSHHSKLTILFDQNNKPHIIIGTGNMCAEEWNICTQAFYYATSNRRSANNRQDNFLSDLKRYLIFFKRVMIPLISELLLWSFRHVKDSLIFSIPGIFHLTRFRKFYSFGKIQYLLTHEEGKEKSKDIKYLIGQCSSIGNLGIKSIPWLQKEFLHFMTNGQIKGIVNMKLIYPSIDNVKDSVSGYEGRKFFPYSLKINKRQYKYMRNILHI
uniref:PLD phosphodiesterase domain-containing protein n=1 Tax=Parastrongyloides trichosuri TaxID=131310 RepID=A0A0N4ZMY3_PARTI